MMHLLYSTNILHRGCINRSWKESPQALLRSTTPEQNLMFLYWGKLSRVAFLAMELVPELWLNHLVELKIFPPWWAFVRRILVEATLNYCLIITHKDIWNYFLVYVLRKYLLGDRIMTLI